MNSLNIDKKKLASLCRKFGILLVVLHGSYAAGRAGKKSDIDIGILAGQKYDADTRMNLLNDFSDLFGDKFDPVFLNGAEPLISYQVAIHGRPLYEERKGLFQQFQIQAAARYRDTKKFRQMEKMYIKKAVDKI
ncbi:MAG: nucleotidyltransferase domain-containing protein [Candidatus Aminicenantes bacterium]